VAEVRARAIVEGLGGVWRGTSGECRCPAHDDRLPSLSVRLGEKAILFHCFAGCGTPDVIMALRRLRLHDRAEVVMPQMRPRRDMKALALRLWRASQPIAGTPAEEYLKARGLFGPFPPALRFPAMIAAVENGLGMVAVQRTFLDPQDILRKPMPRPKVPLGLFGNAAIRLAPATDELGLAEGIEDALSAMQWFGTPTWALGGVERLALVAIPPRVRRVIVYGDRGPAAERLLEKAHDHLTANGRELVSRIPDDHDDWNDALRARQRTYGSLAQASHC
jgi:putative DNA primase/helicase